MNNRPASNSFENNLPDQEPEPPRRALAIGFLPANLPPHLIPYWGIEPASCADEFGDYGEGRALAIGPSGPPIRPLSEAELAAQASAVNFNPYHDERGRFTTGNGAGGGKNDGPDGRGGGETRPASIARYAYPQEGKQNNNRCALYALQTIIAAKTGKEAPSEADVQARFEAEAKKLGFESIDWRLGTYLDQVQYAKITQSVLAGYGVESSAKLGYSSPEALADAIIAAKGEPAMLNISLAGQKDEHSVTVQWEPNATDGSKGVFRINNISSTGGSKLFSREDFAAGKIFTDINQRGSARSMRIKTFSVDTHYPVVIAKPR